MAASPWPGHGVADERTPGGSKASKRACRLLTGEPGVKENAGLEATRECETGGPLSSREKPSSRLMRLGPPPGGLQAKSWRGGESDREELDHAALAVVGCEPARKQRPARAGTAPREGKAL